MRNTIQVVSRLKYHSSCLTFETAFKLSPLQDKRSNDGFPSRCVQIKLWCSFYTFTECVISRNHGWTKYSVFCKMRKESQWSGLPHMCVHNWHMCKIDKLDECVSQQRVHLPSVRISTDSDSLLFRNHSLRFLYGYNFSVDFAHSWLLKQQKPLPSLPILMQWSFRWWRRCS